MSWGNNPFTAKEQGLAIASGTMSVSAGSDKAGIYNTICELGVRHIQTFMFLLPAALFHFTITLFRLMSTFAISSYKTYDIKKRCEG